MKPAPAAPAPRAALRRALAVLFWFAAASLLLSALFGDMGIVQGQRQRHAGARLREEIRALRADDEALAAEIHELKSDPYRIETIAREELGLTRPGEILFLFPGPVPPAGAAGVASPSPSPAASVSPASASPASSDRLP